MNARRATTATERARWVRDEPTGWILIGSVASLANGHAASDAVQGGRYGWLAVIVVTQLGLFAVVGVCVRWRAGS